MSVGDTGESKTDSRNCCRVPVLRGDKSVWGDKWGKEMGRCPLESPVATGPRASVESGLVRCQRSRRVVCRGMWPVADRAGDRHGKNL